MPIGVVEDTTQRRELIAKKLQLALERRANPFLAATIHSLTHERLCSRLVAHPRCALHNLIGAGAVRYRRQCHHRGDWLALEGFQEWSERTSDQVRQHAWGPSELHLLAWVAREAVDLFSDLASPCILIKHLACGQGSIL